MDQIRPLIPLLIPLILLQLALLSAALIDIFRHKRTRGPVWVWVLIVVFISIFGPIVYFLMGREEA
jgi:hypothetical protein